MFSILQELENILRRACRVLKLNKMLHVVYSSDKEDFSMADVLHVIM